MNQFISILGNLNRTTKQVIQIVLDVIIVIISFYISFTIRLLEYNNIFEAINFLYNINYLYILTYLIFITISAQYLSGIYHSVLRFSSDRIIIQIIFVSIISVIFLYISAGVFNVMVPKSVPILYGLFATILFTSIRFLAKFILVFNNTKKIRVLIYGAGEAGRQLVNFLSNESNYYPVAFIDDNKSLRNYFISGLKIFHPKTIGKLIIDKKIDMILLAIPSISRKRRKEIILLLENFKVEVRSMPNMTDIVSGRSKINEIKNISFEELLGRETIPPIKGLMQKNISLKNVLVTGAGGSIGSELCRQIVQQNPKSLILLDNSEFALYNIFSEIFEKSVNLMDIRIIPLLGNIQDQSFINEIIVKYKIETIFHAAAYKHVPLVENNIVESVKNNIVGTYTLLKCATEKKVESFTLISTDKAVNPTNIMGLTKRFAELICLATANENVSSFISIVRFGNVYGSSGSVIPLFSKQISKGGPITVTHEEVARYFMTIKEASELVIQASAMEGKGNIYILEMGKQIKILDVAKRMAQIQGFTPFIKKYNQDGDIEIIIIGLKEGEKIKEELFYSNEKQKTLHPRIICSLENKINVKFIIEKYFEIKVASDNRDTFKIKNILKNLSEI